MYSSTSKQRAVSVLQSWKNDTTIRVFRSSRLTNQFSALSLSKNSKKGSRACYRYDGVYVVKKVWNEGGQLLNKEKYILPKKATGLFTFALERSGVGTSKNILETNELLWKCQHEFYTMKLMETSDLTQIYKTNFEKILETLDLKMLCLPQNPKEEMNIHNVLEEELIPYFIKVLKLSEG